MNLLLFIVTILISFVVVRIGAVAFQLTGLEWSVAKFQSLSCFSGTGFTTREAELIVGSPRRRKIATYLMVLGNAGLVTIIATFANSLRPDSMITRITIPFIDRVIPGALGPVINLVIMLTALFVIYQVFTKSPLTHRFTRWVNARLVKREILRPSSFEELFIMAEGLGVTQAEVPPGSALAGSTLRDTRFSEHHIMVLAVGRGEALISPPGPETVLKAGDRLVCFGKREDIKREMEQTTAKGKTEGD